MNEPQLEAIFHTKGALLILAGAGSGKTTVLVNRIANLISYGDAYNSEEVEFEPDDADIAEMEKYLSGEIAGTYQFDDLLSVDAARPWQILAITFTNKAANELKSRLAVMLGEDDAKEVWASTFHSCCAKILRRYADRAGYDRDFTIYDTDDSKRLIKECQRQLNIDDKRLPHKYILSEISNAKNHLITPVEYLRQAEQDKTINSTIGDVYKLYQSELNKANAMDFDDLIFNTVSLLEECDDVREYYQRKFKYVMVDEYQDTNFAQFRLTRLLADGWGNLCVVGDDDQSIYKFRGATIENILSFEHQYNDCKVIRLEQNYRSTQTILDAANSVIANNRERKGKTLWTANGQGDKIVSYFAADKFDEADYIAQVISDDYLHHDIKYSDHAVLYRANAQSNQIEKSFIRKGIPYRIFGGHKFYDRAEIRDLLAYLTVLNNPEDAIRLTRIINVPGRGIGPTTVNHLMEISTSTGKSVFDIVCHSDEYEKLVRSCTKLKKFAMMMTNLQQFVDEIPLPELLNKVLEATGYIEFLESDKEKGSERIDNVNELLNNLAEYEKENGEETTLQGFLEEVSLMTDIDNYNEQADSAVMMTMHSAKGLEFPVVFIPGMEEGIFPSSMSILDAGEIEEERRLAYVAITRAKKNLYLIHAKERSLYGDYAQHNAQSRFLNEIPDELLDRKESPKITQDRNSFSRGGYGAYGSRGGYSRSSNYADPPFYDESTGYKHKAPVAMSMSKAKPKAKEPVETDFKVGERVESKTLGQGTVLTVKPMAKDSVLEVAFDKVGTKRLMASFAGLKHIDS